MAIVVTIIEAISVKGIDNISVPVIVLLMFLCIG